MIPVRVIAAILALATVPGSTRAQGTLPQVPLTRTAAVVRALEVNPELQARLREMMPASSPSTTPVDEDAIYGKFV